MRILFLSPTLGIGGSETLTYRYATQMRARGHQAIVAYAWVDQYVERLERAGVRCVLVSRRPLTPRTVPQWDRALRRLVPEFRPTVIHAQSVTAAVAARMGAPRLPLLITLHGLEQAKHERLAAIALALTRGTLTAVSERAAHSVGRYFPHPPIEVLPAGVDVAELERFAQDPVPPAPGHPHFCCVARHEPVKGVDVLVRAFAQVHAQLPEAGLTLVGDGSASPAYRALAGELGIAERIRFTGRIPNALPYIAGADVGVLPSRREGLPVVALETLAVGRPMVATAVGGTPSAVRDGETGWLVPPEDPDRLAAALVAAGSDLEEAARRGEAGRRLVREEFDPDRLYDRLEELLLAVAGETRDPAERRRRQRRQHEAAPADGSERRVRDRRTPVLPSVPPLKPRPWYLAVRAHQRARLAMAPHAQEWSGVRIFGYHRISDDHDDVLSISPADFRRHMRILAESGVAVVALEEALDLLARPVEGRHACITFDDAFADVAEQAAPILADFGFPATVFVPTAVLDRRVAYSWYDDPPAAMTWDQVRELVATGLWSAQAHSRTHPPLPALDREEAAAEIAGSKADLERRVGAPVTTFAYPADLYTEREVELVREAGFRAGVTCRAGVNPGGGSLHELRRTMILWRDGEREFGAKLGGALDRPSVAADWVRRRRLPPAAA